MEDGRIKELLHWMFRRREGFVCSKAQAEELKRVLLDARLTFQGFPEGLRPELVDAIVRQLRDRFGSDGLCLDATTLYIAQLDRIIQSKQGLVVVV